MTHDPKAMLKLADEIAQHTYDGWISLKASDSATIVAALRSAAAHQSAPAISEIKAHLYSPDYQAMGDCRVCGHGMDHPAHDAKLDQLRQAAVPAVPKRR